MNNLCSSAPEDRDGVHNGCGGSYFTNATKVCNFTPGSDWFLGVDTQQEVSLLVRFECRRYDAVGARRQPVTTGDLTDVDELRRFGNRRVVLEKVEVQRPAVGILQLYAKQQNFVY